MTRPNITLPTRGTTKKLSRKKSVQCCKIANQETPPRVEAACFPSDRASRTGKRGIGRMPTEGHAQDCSQQSILPATLFDLRSHMAFLAFPLFNYCLGFSFAMYVGRFLYVSKFFLVSLRTYLTSKIVRAVDFGS